MKYRCVSLLLLLFFFNYTFGAEEISPVKKVVAPGRFRFDPYMIKNMAQGLSHATPENKAIQGIVIAKRFQQPQGSLQELLDSESEETLDKLFKQKLFSQEAIILAVIEISKNFSTYKNDQNTLCQLNKLLSHLQHKDWLNLYDKRGQTLAHQVIIQAKLPLLVLLSEHVDFTKQTQLPDWFEGSTPGHILAGILRGKLHRYKDPRITELQTCLLWLLQKHPRIKKMTAGVPSLTIRNILLKGDCNHMNEALKKELRLSQKS